MADRKQSSNANPVIIGSGVLIGSLMAADLIDEYLLMIAPVVLGTGRRLFAGGTHASLRLLDSSTTSTGVLIATYAPARGEGDDNEPFGQAWAERPASGRRRSSGREERA